MSDIIQLLPDSVANQIAAGEVIQRPSSVIKELVENAIDAGATTINVAVTDAGKTCIQIIDNGKGMSVTDARMAFERHATSKIKTAADLFALHTMGFRGEALASIAAVAQVELRTKTDDEEIGTSIVIEGSRVLSQEPISCPTGANFVVKNLFYNVPARRKFLKTDSTEMNNILTEMERIMLVHPDISFSLRHNDTDIYAYHPSSLKKRIVDVLGRKIGQQLLPINVETSMANIKGYVSTPESSRKKASQFFFVNNRYMRHPYFQKAVMEAYDKLIPQGDQISFFIYFDVNPADIDVNIHPTKTEIKFENEQAIWKILLAAVRESLSRFSAVPTIDFDVEGMPDIPPMTAAKTHIAPPKVSIDRSFNPFKEVESRHSTPSSKGWQELYDGLRKGRETEASSWNTPIDDTDEGFVVESRSNDAPIEREESYFESQSKLVETSAYDNSSQYYQHKGRYIMTSVRSVLMFIDQHRGHVKVLYEKFKKNIDSKNGASQGVLFPEIINLSAAEAVTMDSMTEDLASLGFDIANLGGGSYSVNSIPADIVGIDYVKLLTEMVDTASTTGKDVKEDLRSSIALSLAKAAAIPYGQILSSQEMAELVGALLALPLPDRTPDGKHVLTIIAEEEIDKLLK